MGSGKILIKNLELFGRHGVLPGEQKGQIFKIDLELSLNVEAATESDELKNTVDYREAIRKVADLVEGKRFRLLETLAEEIADIIISHFPVDSVRVVVKKPHAPLAKPVEWVGVEIDRKRNA